MTRNENASSCAETPQNPPPECQEWKGRYIWVDTEPTCNPPDSETPSEALRRRRGPGGAGKRQGSVSPAREKEKKEKKEKQQRDETPSVSPQTKEENPPVSPQTKEEPPKSPQTKEEIPSVSPQTKEEPPKSPQTSPSSSPSPSRRGDQEGPQGEPDPDPSQRAVKRFFGVLCEAMKGFVVVLGYIRKALVEIKEIVTIFKDFSKMF